MKSFFQKYFVLIGIIVSAGLVYLDQWTKMLAVERLKDKAPFVIIEDIFEFHYYENNILPCVEVLKKENKFIILPHG